MRVPGIVAALLVVAGCAGTSPGSFDVPTLTPEIDLPPLPELDPAQAARGAELYTQYCAECHRLDLSGDPDWKTPASDGGFRPPPQDASGHTWHHPDGELVEIVLRGYDPPVAQSRMAPFAGTLTEDDVLAILDYLKSSWGIDERLYQWEQTVRTQTDG